MDSKLPTEAVADGAKVVPKTFHEKNFRRTLAGSIAGTFMEYYDFGVYGTMSALVLGRLFFAEAAPSVALMLSFATLAVGFVLRPLGAVVAGYFGDIYGRKRVLVVVLILAGVSTALIGVLPTYAAVGVAGPILLILLRCVQGLAVGGETAGAALMVNESAPAGRRGFFTACVAASTAAGYVFANVVVLVFALMGDDALLSWGWRLPFIFGFLIVLIAVFIRAQVNETDEFKAMRSQLNARRLQKRENPLRTAFRTSPGRILTITGIAFGWGALAYTTSTWVVGYLSLQGRDSSVGVTGVVLSQIALAVSSVASGAASDRFGRRMPMILGSVLYVLGAFPILSMILNGNDGMVWLGMSLFMTFAGMIFGPVFASMCEVFGVDHRYSGASTSYQLGLSLGAGFTPLLATWVVSVSSTYWPVSVMMVAAALICLISAYKLRETVADER